ncbi:3-beta hydroxysteroid dehydrogenase [Enterobacterales bacterium CwR94]|nr:3-beta hydroxysteroid dehydrogenase [Enterobacterales bacterium CwR94]
MKIAVIGATGFVGPHIVQEALSRGHQVTAIARNTSKVTPAEHLDIQAGDIADTAWLSAVLREQDAVVSAFNPGWGEADLYEKTTAGRHLIMQAVKSSGVKRLLVVGGAGSLQVAPGVELVDTAEFPAAIKPGALAVRDWRNDLQQHEQGLQWTYLSPAAFLVEGERTGHFRVGGVDLLMAGEQPASVSVADLAVAIVDELEQSQHIHQQFTVGY